MVGGPAGAAEFRRVSPGIDQVVGVRRGPPLPPDRLLDLDGVGFCRVCAPRESGGCNVRAHGDCERPGKRPVEKPEREELVRVVRWVEKGGNVGVVLTGDLVCIDQDDRVVSGVVAPDFPTSFVVRSGSGLPHSYYRCPEWDRGTVALKDDDGAHVGEIRSGEGTIVVAPPSLHESGRYYSVLYDVEIAEVERADLDALASRFGSDDQDDAGDRRDRGGGDDLDELDELIHHDERRREVREVLADPDAGHTRRVWLAGFLLDAVGLSVSETVGLIDRHNRWSNYDREITREQVRSVARSSGGRS